MGLKYAELTERIIGIFYDVYNELGFGFLESVYEESLVIVLRDAGLAVECQLAVPVWFRDREVGRFEADIVVDGGAFCLSKKSARGLEAAHEAQLLYYLRSTEIEVGLLLNFGPRPQFRHLLFDNERKKIRANPRKSVAEVST
jgi:GxxExxY protein